MITMSASPSFVPANGGVSVITAILVEPAGTFAPDGTEVFFFTNLGRVDASGKSVDGVVRVNFVSDSRSGKATVTGISGGPAPSAPTTPTTTQPAGGALDVTASASTVPRVLAAGDIATAQNQDQVTIDIGNALPTRVLVTANPPVLANARAATIVANVFDANGNPVQNVPVFFTLSVGADVALQEVLESGGAPRYTDSNGQAFDVLRTKAPFSDALPATQKTVTVTATTANALTDDVAVIVSFTASTRG
jgi:hypothetical protein